MDTYQDLAGQAKCFECAEGYSTNGKTQQSQCEDDDGIIEELEDGIKYYNKIAWNRDFMIA